MESSPIALLRQPHAKLAEAAELAGVAVKTLRRWIDAGTVRSFMVGGRRHVMLEDLPVGDVTPRRKAQRVVKTRAEYNARVLANC